MAHMPLPDLSSLTLNSGRDLVHKASGVQEGEGLDIVDGVYSLLVA